jgi:serine O-acetyltransferase
MFEIVHKDIIRYITNNHSKLYIIIHSPGLSTLLTYRLGRWLRNFVSCPLKLPIFLVFTPFYWLLTGYCRLSYDIYLDQSAEIGHGLYIGHFGGIVLKNCQIGSNCSIHQEVRLESTATSKYGPIIGDHVWIGPHVRIQGMFKVGNRSTIAAGAIVKKDVGEDCLLIGNPARVVKNKYDNKLMQR